MKVNINVKSDKVKIKYYDIESISEFLSKIKGSIRANNRFSMISVRPDWNDSTDLIGYKNLNDDFVEGSLTKIIK
ncbi:hypothetical protein [Alkalithermobacter thermoalcaliphilus]|uniref:hypothetical protein n=1 Tax=Clostridium paradoxum TaxID=29346 RepID=UPI000A740EF4